MAPLAVPTGRLLLVLPQIQVLYSRPRDANPTLLRDGGISSNGGAPYVYNTPGEPAIQLVDAAYYELTRSIAFDASADAGTQTSVTDFTPLHRLVAWHAGQPSLDGGEL